jgi:hypothetical protein
MGLVRSFRGFGAGGGLEPPLFPLLRLGRRRNDRAESALLVELKTPTWASEASTAGGLRLAPAMVLVRSFRGFGAGGGLGSPRYFRSFAWGAGATIERLGCHSEWRRKISFQCDFAGRFSVRVRASSAARFKKAVCWRSVGRVSALFGAARLKTRSSD